jgi:hypothetical protein
MPKVIPNALLLQGISGAIGNLVFYRDASGNWCVKPKGKRTAPPSPKQIAHKERVRLAAAYGNMVKTDPALCAEYRLSCHGRMSPYHAALRDFLTPPTVIAIDLQTFSGQPGQLICVTATDDTRVMSVEVLIRHVTTGVIFEEGPTSQSVAPDRWVYTTTRTIAGGTPLLVEVTAFDRPGNLGTAKVQYFLP